MPGTEGIICAEESIEPADSSIAVDRDKYLPDSLFTFAGSPMYTITGDKPLLETRLRPVTASIVGASYIGLFYLQHQLQMNTIWKEQGDFKFMEDGQYALYSDKAGHVFGAYLTSYFFRETFVVSGMSWEMSNILGAALGLSYSTYVEILDGFGVNWGFSPTDFYADIGGAALFLGQYYWPFLQNFTPKFMYFPADWHGEMPRKNADAFIDDYSSHTLWLSVNVHNLLPDNMKPYWPDWLELSFGYAARNLCAPQHGCDEYTSKLHTFDNGAIRVYGDPKFIIALDYNLAKLLPEGGSFWNWTKQTLNWFKLPSPAVEIGSDVRFFLVYPFPL